jgi:colanic acid/amylovoran biosynthesis glycosyltransferase
VNVLYLVKHFPCRSQTFVLNEVAALTARGCGVYVVSAIDLHEPIDLDPLIASRVVYLQHEYLYRYGEPDASTNERYVREAHAALTAPGSDVPSHVRHSLWDLLGELEGDAATRARGFLDALTVVSVMQKHDIAHLHCDFAEDNVKLAHVVSRATGVPFTFKMRAYDIFAEPHPMLPVWTGAARCIFTISRYNRDYICQTWGITPDRVVVVHDGVDLEQTTPIDRYVHRPFRIVSVSRLVEKKGFTVLLEACRLLKDTGRVAFHCDIYGDGPMRADLEHQVADLALGDAVTLHGNQSHGEVLAALESASVFVLACVQARNGDRDGTPNAILEAMVRGVPVVSTRLSGIPEIVEADVDGLLVSPGDAAALTEALGRLASDRDLAERLRHAAQNRVRTRFTIGQTVQAFLDALAQHATATQRHKPSQHPGSPA